MPLPFKKERDIKKRKPIFKKKKVCRFCVDGANHSVDHRDFSTIKPFVTERGKIIPSRITGNCAKHQRRVTEAIKRSRCIAVSPFTAVSSLASQ